MLNLPRVHPTGGDGSHWSNPSSARQSVDDSWDGGGGDSGQGTHRFPDTFSWDFSVLALTEDECEHLVEQLLEQLGLLDDIGFDVPVLRRFIHACRKAHKPHTYTNWWRAVNACQAVAVFLHSTGAGALEKMALEDAAALMLSSASGRASHGSASCTAQTDSLLSLMQPWSSLRTTRV